MDYALTLFVPMMGGLLLGLWLSRQYGWSVSWSMGLAAAGFACGMVLLWKRASYPELYGQAPLSIDPVSKPGDASTSSTVENTPGIEHSPGNVSAVGKIYETLEDKPDDLDWEDEDED